MAGADEPPYTIIYDAETEVLALRVVGLWSPLVLASFGTALLAKTTWLKMRGQRYDVLSDSRNFAVQTGIVARGFERMMARGVHANVGHMAIVVGSVLNKLQATRSLQHERLRVFLDLAEAQDWLIQQRKSGVPVRG